MIIKQSQHWPMSFTDILPVLAFTSLNLTTNVFVQPTFTPLYSDPFNLIVRSMQMRTFCWLVRVWRGSPSRTFFLDGINIQWDNFTHLTLHSMLIDDSLIILRQTPWLVVCKVSGYSPKFRGRIRTVVLTSLKPLQLTNFAGDFLNNLVHGRVQSSRLFSSVNGGHYPFF